MNRTGHIEIRRGLPESQRQRAAELYWQAFRQKFIPIIRSDEKGLAILAEGFDPEMAIVALGEGRLIGLAGLQYGGRQFNDLKLKSFVSQFGWLSGPLKLLLFALFLRTQQDGELLMDGIVVDRAARGRGVGTKLLESVVDVAADLGFSSVRLDVVDTNPGARRLYERMGFQATKTKHLPFLRNLMGFSAATTMIRRIG